MSETDEALRRWTEAGLVDEATAARIRAFEAARAARGAPGPRPTERPGLIEVLLYLGVAVLAVGVFALLAQNWDDLASLPRVLAIGVPTGFALLVGALLRSSPEAGLRRGGQFAWAAAVPLLAGTIAVVLNEYELLGIEGDSREQALAVALVATGTALALWAVSPATLQVLALGGSLLFLAQSIGNWPDDFSAPLAGCTLVVLALVGILLAETGRMTPRDVSRFAFGALLAFGAYQPGFESGGTLWELLGFATSAALLGLGVARGSFAYILSGVALLFAALVRGIFQNFSDQLGAPVALIISGALLISAVILLARLAPSLRKAST